MTTATEVLERHGFGIPLDDTHELDVSVLSSLQRQGDVLIVPRGPLTEVERTQATVVPPEGVALVVGEATGNTHMLSPDPGASVLHNRRDADLLIGVIEVPVDGAAWLIHTDEHAVLGIGPGTYEVRGKRTQREVVERVQD